MLKSGPSGDSAPEKPEKNTDYTPQLIGAGVGLGLAAVGTAVKLGMEHHNHVKKTAELRSRLDQKSKERDQIVADVEAKQEQERALNDEIDELEHHIATTHDEVMTERKNLEIAETKRADLSAQHRNKLRGLREKQNAPLLTPAFNQSLAATASVSASASADTANASNNAVVVDATARRNERDQRRAARRIQTSTNGAKLV